MHSHTYTQYTNNTHTLAEAQIHTGCFYLNKFFTQVVLPAHTHTLFYSINLIHCYCVILLLLPHYNALTRVHCNHSGNTWYTHWLSISLSWSWCRQEIKGASCWERCCSINVWLDELVIFLTQQLSTIYVFLVIVKLSVESSFPKQISFRNVVSKAFFGGELLLFNTHTKRDWSSIT